MIYRSIKTTLLAILAMLSLSVTLGPMTHFLLA